MLNTSNKRKLILHSLYFAASLYKSCSDIGNRDKKRMESLRLLLMISKYVRRRSYPSNPIYRCFGIPLIINQSRWSHGIPSIMTSCCERTCVNPRHIFQHLSAIFLRPSCLHPPCRLASPAPYIFWH